MNDLERLQNAFMKADAAAQAGDAQAAADAKAFAGEIRRIQSAPQPAHGGSFMGQVNAGIADSAGGLVDLINPFDDPVWAQYGMQTGSAREGLKSGMRGIGAAVDDAPPEGALQGFARGAGQAAGAIIPVARGAQALQALPGVAGAVAGQVARPLATAGGAVAEVAAGGLSGGAQEAARQAGAAPWAQQAVGMLAPMALPVAGSVIAGAGRLAARTPGVGGIAAAARSLMPQSRAAAFDVASARAKELAGGAGRALELAGRIGGRNDLGLTPAQQTADPNLMGLQDEVARADPVVRERLAAQTASARATATEGMTSRGEVADAKAFFAKRQSEFVTALRAKADAAVKGAAQGVKAAVGTIRSETSNSKRVLAKVKASLQESLTEERALWGAVPKDALVLTKSSKAAAKSLMDNMPKAQVSDFPVDARRILLDGGLGDTASVREMHGLYSKLREVSRNAKSGDQVNANMARVADRIAEAILDDLGAVSVSDPVGMAINEARAFSRALHQTYDQGAVGKILTRTIDGDERIAPETVMARTVGRGGAQAVADNQSILGAAPDADIEIKDYLRGRFLESIYNSKGEIDPEKARAWFVGNQELLAKYPEMRGELLKASRGKAGAMAMEAKINARAALAERTGATKFGAGQNEKAFLRVIAADDPVKTARSIVATARKDKTGKALAGVKASVSDYLIGKAGTPDGLSGDRLQALMKDPQTLAAMRQIMDGAELSRMQAIASDLAKIDTPSANVGGIVNAQPNRILSYVVRVAAARAGSSHASGSGMGGSLQAANIATRMAGNLLDNLTNRQARALLVKAVEDPELFRALLTSPGAIKPGSPAYSKLAPYLVGAGAATMTEE